MKTIIIPKSFGHPTVDIVVNGKKYTVKSGEEVTIEDHIAEVIENAMALAPKYEVLKNRFAQSIEGTITEITAEDLGGISLISTCAFYNKLNLRKVTIPDNIKTISTNVFAYCGNLDSIYLPEIPPTLVKVTSFDNINSNAIFYCKTQASLDAYKAATNWSTLAGTYTFAVEHK
jgi:hypothetical protein